jgi:YVTN family beta-propeller protein
MIVLYGRYSKVSMRVHLSPRIGSGFRQTLIFGVGSHALMPADTKSRVGESRVARVLTGMVLLQVLSVSLLAQESGLLQPSGIVYGRNNGKVYAVDSVHDVVAIISADGAVKSVATGRKPLAIAVNEHTGNVYVANSGDRSVTVLDGTTGRGIATVATTAIPYAIVADEEANKIYVSNTFSNLLTVIDGATNIASYIKTGSADALMLDKKRRRLYLLGYESSALTVLDLATGAITKQPAGATHLWGIAESGETLYVTHVQDASLAAIDVETGAVGSIVTGSMPCAVAVDAESGEVYVANYGDGTVTVLDSRHALIATITVGGHPQAVAIDGGRVYVAKTRENSVSILDIRSHNVAKEMKVPGHPYALAVNAKTHKVYAATMGVAAYAELEPRR